MGSVAEARNSLFVRDLGLSDRVVYRPIETREEKDQLYLMRYRAYRRNELIPASEAERYGDHYDDAPNALTFGVHIDGELCSSIRLHLLTSEQRMSYTAELFSDVLHPRLDQGETFIDPARFVADPEKARRFPELPYLTLRLAYMACEHFNVDTGLALVRAGHQRFYRQVFLYETIAEPRQFPNALVEVGLMASDFRARHDQVLARFPIMRSSAFERRKLFLRRGERQSPPRGVVTSFDRASTVPNP
jgi:hypothetical protein